MERRVGYLLPVLLALSACSMEAPPPPVAMSAPPPQATSYAKVSAASDALGARMDSMVSMRRTASATVAR